MGKRVPMTKRVDEDIKSRFKQFVKDKHGNKRGAGSDELEKALLRHMGEDEETVLTDEIRDNRDEIQALREDLREMMPTHTHTDEEESRFDGQPRSESFEKAKAIHDNLASVYDGTVKNKKVEIEIAKIAGGHRDTKNTYREHLKNFDLLFEHPSNAPIWFFEKEPFFKTVSNELERNPDKLAEHVLEDYSAQIVADYKAYTSRPNPSASDGGQEVVADGGSDDD